MPVEPPPNQLPTVFVSSSSFRIVIIIRHRRDSHAADRNLAPHAANGFAFERPKCTQWKAYFKPNNPTERRITQATVNMTGVAREPKRRGIHELRRQKCGIYFGPSKFSRDQRCLHIRADTQYLAPATPSWHWSCLTAGSIFACGAFLFAAQQLEQCMCPGCEIFAREARRTEHHR